LNVEYCAVYAINRLARELHRSMRKFDSLPAANNPPHVAIHIKDKHNGEALAMDSAVNRQIKAARLNAVGSRKRNTA
jgi:hypothetical protein